eukprot:CAMPEP_0202888312 /NCGR_PEP_ID=MMETSP1391-20130828/43127_1 /ASSEMBLY_ACC=CAM_ASM_000867 /TAXON_ID=1034604 /ORGANISM="Chlamydomonas leiostraca, Strain SAG 11-49" /LENGTH=69 /DNA_ID=CAMNT_0049571613 /DNA_START=807 /DNA_END=1017 /DNA_ORIENTATION=-
MRHNMLPSISSPISSSSAKHNFRSEQLRALPHVRHAEPILEVDVEERAPWVRAVHTVGAGLGILLVLGG